MTLGKDLTTGSIKSHLVKLTIPMFLGVASMIVAAMVDTVYIGQIGSAELAALGFCFPLIMILVSLSIGISVGATSIIARFAGMGDQAAVKRFATHSILLSVVLAGSITALGSLYHYEVLALLGATGDVLRLADVYLNYWMLGYPVFSFSLFAGNIMRAIGEASLPGLVMIMSAVLQMVIGPFLIFGIAGLPRMEIEGAAWGFVISRVITAVWTLWLVVYTVPLLTSQNLAPMDILRSFARILRIGIPASVSSLMGPVSLLVVVIILANHGPVIVASFSIYVRVEALATMVLIALSASTVPFIGQNWGAQKFQRAQRALSLSYRFCLVYGFIAAIILMLLGEPLLAFVSTDAEVVEVTYLNLLWVSWTFAFFGSAQISLSVFLALGQARAVLIMGAIRMFVIYLPLVWFGNLYFGYPGVFAGIALANFATAILAYFWAEIFFGRHLKAVSVPSAVTHSI